MFEIIFGVFAAIFALIFLGVGIVALIGGFQQKKRCSASAPGVVSKVNAEEQYKGKRRVTIYTSEFQFEANGQTCTIHSSFGSMRPEFKEGQTVTIRFDPADPAFAYVDDDTSNSAGGGVMCVCIGILLVVAAVALFT